MNRKTGPGRGGRPRTDHVGARVGLLVGVRPLRQRRRAVVWLWRCTACGAEVEQPHATVAFRVRRDGLGCWPCASATPAPPAPRAEPAATYQICDTVTRQPYLALTFASATEARDELADLLQPYPARHYWRRRLQAVRVGDAVPAAPRDREPGAAAVRRTNRARTSGARSVVVPRRVA